MILNGEELSALVHMPDAAVRIDGIDRVVRQTRAAPSAPSQGVVLGENFHRGPNVACPPCVWGSPKAHAYHWRDRNGQVDPAP